MPKHNGTHWIGSITAEQVKQIRGYKQYYKPGKVNTPQQVADELGISVHIVRNVYNSNHYNNVE